MKTLIYHDNADNDLDRCIKSVQKNGYTPIIVDNLHFEGSWLAGAAEGGISRENHVVVNEFKSSLIESLLDNLNLFMGDPWFSTINSKYRYVDNVNGLVFPPKYDQVGFIYGDSNKEFFHSFDRSQKVNTYNLFINVQYLMQNGMPRYQSIEEMLMRMSEYCLGYHVAEVLHEKE